jgi:hypothetical protein
MPVLYQESERSCISVLEVMYFCVKSYRFCSFLRFFYWILEMFLQCGIFVFHFISHHEIFNDNNHVCGVMV